MSEHKHLSADDLAALAVGKRYRVKIRGQRNRRVRTCLGVTERFGPAGIPCAVFSTAHRRNGGGGYSGQWSVPHYDLEACEEV